MKSWQRSFVGAGVRGALEPLAYGARKARRAAAIVTTDRSPHRTEKLFRMSPTPQPSQNRRLSTFAEAARHLSEMIEGKDAADAVEVLRRAMKAKTTIRSSITIPAEHGGRTKLGIVYKEVDDYPTQLAAAKMVLEFKFGRAPQAITVTANPNADDVLTPAQAVQALEDFGGDLAELAGFWVASMKRVAPAAPAVTPLQDTKKDQLPGPLEVTDIPE